jgi:D-alanyl-D-alanine endopeptidase (penicillin-binding protein 7)
MYKLALAAAVSMLFALGPTVAAAKSAKPAHHHVKKVSVKKDVAQDDSREHLVRRVSIVHGKRRVSWQHVRRAGGAIAVPLSAGELAGLSHTSDALDLRSNVALVLDEATSQVLFEKNAAVALPIASITKLMTGLVVVQAHQDMDELLTITDADVDRHKFTSSRLRVGARMTRGDLLHIALMSSENRAAAALGRNYPGGISAFVEAMNDKASELDMDDTHYVDSSGLSSQNVSSARDLAKLVGVAHEEPLLREYTTDPNHAVAVSGRPMQFHNTNYLVSLPDWNIGLQKTGFINEAGRCLVMQALIQGRNVIMVFLDSKGKMSRTADAGRMRHWLEAIKLPSLTPTTTTTTTTTTSTATTTTTDLSSVTAPVTQ